MQHPFEVLAPEYAALLPQMRVLPARQHEVNLVVDRLLTFDAAGRYDAASAATGVPKLWMAPSFEREAASDFSRSPAQGDHWNRTSVHVPAGRGPFPDWKSAAIDAYHIDGLDAIGAANWVWPRALFEGELFNGFGPRNHGRRTGYLWGGTNVYNGGKYVSDGVWDPDYQDQQLGMVPVMVGMALRRSTLDLVGGLPGPLKIPSIPPSEIQPPGPSPVGVTAPNHDAKWVQMRLNDLLKLDPPLQEDGSYGRLTRGAVRQFQIISGLDVDGFVGPKTEAALEQNA